MNTFRNKFYWNLGSHKKFDPNRNIFRVSNRPLLQSPDQCQTFGSVVRVIYFNSILLQTIKTEVISRFLYCLTLNQCICVFLYYAYTLQYISGVNKEMFFTACIFVQPTAKFLIPVCCLMWRLRLLCLFNSFPQTVQINFVPENLLPPIGTRKTNLVSKLN